MNETVQKKKMSTGCLVAIIVVSVVLLAIIALALYCYSNREKIMGFTAVKVIQQLKTEAAANPQPGVDTTQVDAVADQFIAAINAQEKPDAQALANFVTGMQSAFKDKKIDSSEVRTFFTAAKAYDTSLTIPPPLPTATDTTGAATDTSGTATDTAGTM